MFHLYKIDLLAKIFKMIKNIQGVSKKMSRSFCLISKAKSCVRKLDISQLKGDIHRYVLSTSSFLCDIGEMRYQQNNGGYQII